MSDSSSYKGTNARRYERTKRAWEVVKALAGVRLGSQDVYEADILLDAIEKGIAIVSVEWIEDGTAMSPDVLIQDSK